MSMQHKLMAGAGALVIALALSPTVASARGGGGFSGAGMGARGVSTMGSGGVRGTTITGSMIPTHAPLTQSHPAATSSSPSATSTSPNVTFQQRTLDPPPGGVDSASSPATHPQLTQPSTPGAVPQTQPNAPTTHPLQLDGTQGSAGSQTTHPPMAQPHTTLTPLARPNAPQTHPAAPDMLHRTIDPPGGN